MLSLIFLKLISYTVTGERKDSATDIRFKQNFIILVAIMCRDFGQNILLIQISLS